MPERHADNAPGDWYVDTKCMDCSAARTAAPGLIVARGGQSVFARQPETPEELMMAWRARLLCPTASVRTASRAAAPAGVFPEEMTRGVYRLGYNARASYGAHSFLIRRGAGNAMVDAPRWTKPVVGTIEAWGGLADILLTHKDDVADADRYARHFGARVTIHEADRSAAPYADNVLTGRDRIALGDDLLAIPVPGHTEGSVVFLWDNRCLFTGDSLAWNFAANDLGAFRDFCWYSWEEQRRSLARLLDYSFAWVFAGHGGSHGAPAAEMKSRLAALVERMGGDNLLRLNEKSPSPLEGEGGVGVTRDVHETIRRFAATTFATTRPRVATVSTRARASTTAPTSRLGTRSCSGPGKAPRHQLAYP